MRTEYLVFKGRSAIFIALAATLLLPVPGMALTTTCSKLIVTICSDQNAAALDCDGDGLSDYDECKGYTTQSGVTFIGPGISTPNAAWSDTAIAENMKLNPAKADLFYAIADTTGSNVTADSSNSLIKQALKGEMSTALTTYSTELGIVTHLVKREDLADNRNIPNMIMPMRGAVLTEITNPANTTNSGALGSTPAGGKVNDVITSQSQIYTQRIVNDVNSKCGGDFAGITKVKGAKPLCTVLGTNITNATSTSGVYDNTPIIYRYILRVMSHEMAHESYLAPPTLGSRVVASYHYLDTSTLMSSSASYSNGVFTIPLKADPLNDPKNAQLK